MTKNKGLYHKLIERLGEMVKENVELEQRVHQLTDDYNRVVRKLNAQEEKAATEKTPADLKPFDKVLVRDVIGETWLANIFSHMSNGDFFCIGSSVGWEQCIPYNDKTARLLGTNLPYKE